MRLDEIINVTNFEDWLKKRPEETRSYDAIVLAHRTALRVIPFLQRKGALNHERHASLLLSVLWSSAISRVEIRNSTFEIVRAALDAAEVANNDSRSAIDASKDAIDPVASNISFRSATLAIHAAQSTVAVAIGSARFYKAEGTVNELIENAKSTADLAVRTVLAARIGAKSIWREIQKDIELIEHGTSNIDLLSVELWHEAPVWWESELRAYQKTLTEGELASDGFGFWAEWYYAIAFGKLGKPVFGIQSATIRNELERNIALGSTDGNFNKSFWSRQRKEINADITLWVADSRAKDISPLSTRTFQPVFLSYNSTDKVSAEHIGAVIEKGGFAVFSQYKDMKPGNHFIAQMQTGLEVMGKFVPLYSPEYQVSDYCQAEFNAAYQMDPLGKRKLIVGLMLRPTKLMPLQQGIVHIPIYHLEPEHAEKEIIAALRGDMFNKSKAEWRMAAAEVASHIVTKNADGKWDLKVSQLDKASFLDNDILRLPDHVLNLAKALRHELKRDTSNAPSAFQSYLNNYIDEREANGVNASNSILNDWADLIAAQLSIGKDTGWADVNAPLFQKFLEAHRMYIQHYPAIMRRDILADNSQIDPAKFDSLEHSDSVYDLVEKTKAAFADGAVTDDFLKNVETDAAQRKAILDLVGNHVPALNGRFLSNTGELSPDDLKRRYLFEKGGKWEKARETMSSIGKGAAEKGTSVAIADALKKLAEWIFF
jgi:hypothetical protein